ncbi:MAG TPA: ATP-binding protein [Phycisphaerae bacterium]|nr:ATP-binding protein [Phycisphaerae bacterium]HRY67874.1 ATP-binding protein [Phycisphaerae bacterium]HSA25328.1 ATP-binding protein [Phycisphaerae bacterium]
MATAVQQKVSTNQVPLIAADKALISLRSSGHDYCSAVGEVIDNSLQANANTIRARVFTAKKTIGKNKRATEVVERLAVGDDGDGMDVEVLHNSLKLGYSTRYNDRTGMGRFGVGAKMGGISQAKRIEIYSRQSTDDPWLRTYIDLDEIEAKKMEHIPAPEPAELPNGCEDLPGPKGTLVVWSKTDRLEENESGGGRRADTVRTDIVRYIARTFRKFLDKGIGIQFDGKPVFSHDPLFLMTSTQFHQDGVQDPVAEIKVSEAIDFPIPSDPARKSTVQITLTLLPKDFRRDRGAGGNEFARDRRISENEGISILRADREIFNGFISGVQPSLDGRPIDRFIGKEIRFEPELDECFHVRNVKKGAEPIEGLRDKLRERLFNSIKTLRDEVRRHFDEVEKQVQLEQGVHAEAEKIAAETQRTARKPKAGKDTPQAVVEQKIEEAAESLVKELPEEQKANKKEQVKARIKTQPYTVVPESWPGKEMFVVEHLGSTMIVKLNMQHPFYTEVYAKLLSAEKREDDGDLGRLAKTTRLGIDLLIAGYARGEGGFEDLTAIDADELRTNWGLEVRSLIQHWRKNQ